MKRFFNQIFKKHGWVHFETEQVDSVSDFSIIFINFIAGFLVSGFSAYVTDGIRWFPGSLIAGLIFAFIAFLKCLYEFMKIKNDRKIKLEKINEINDSK